MRPKLFRSLIVILLASAALCIVACNKARSDAQVVSEIQGRINADQTVRSKQISVLAASGVVTLSGSVNSEAERSAIASDAASIGGVRTVVNNLTVQSANASAAPNESQSPAVNQQPAPTASQPPASQPATPARVRKPSASRQSSQYRQNSAPPSQTDTMGQQRNTNEPAQNLQSAAPPVSAPAPPPPPEKITIPDGTALALRMSDTLDSETASPGDTFRATLNSPVQVDGRVVIPADADVFGRVVAAQSAGRFKGSALLTLELTKVSFNGRTYPIHTDQWSKETQGRGRNTAEKVGGGAALGAIIGAIAGGGKGAGIGTAVGAGAGGVAQGVTKPAQVKLGPESLLTFHLAQPVTVQPSSYSDRNAGRQHLD